MNQLIQLVRQNINLDKKQLNMIKPKKIGKKLVKQVKSSGARLVKDNGIMQSVKGTLNAFSDVANISSLVNPQTTTKLVSRARSVFNTASDRATYVMMSPNCMSDTITENLTNVSLPDFEYSPSTVDVKVTGNIKRGYELVALKSAGGSSQVGSLDSGGIITANQYPALKTSTELFTDETRYRIVSVGVRIQNRTASLYKIPVVYVFHDYNGELANKIRK